MFQGDTRSAQCHADWRVHTAARYRHVHVDDRRRALGDPWLSRQDLPRQCGIRRSHPRLSVETVVNHVRREAEVGGYRAAIERLDDLAAVKTSIGTLIKAPASAIALSDSASRSWADFFYSVELPLQPGIASSSRIIEYGEQCDRRTAAGSGHRCNGRGDPRRPNGRIDRRSVRTHARRTREARLAGPRADEQRRSESGSRAVADLAHAWAHWSCSTPASPRVSSRSTSQNWGSTHCPRRAASGCADRVGPDSFTWIQVSISSLADSTSTARPGALRRTFDDHRRRLHDSNSGNSTSRHGSGLGTAVDYLLRLGPDSVHFAISSLAATIRTALAISPASCPRSRRTNSPASCRSRSTEWNRTCVRDATRRAIDNRDRQPPSLDASRHEPPRSGQRHSGFAALLRIGR